MRQVWITRAGEPSVLQVREAPDPTPGPGQIRIRAAACGVNFADVMARLGLYLDAPKIPCVVGYEVAGTVDAVGPDVKDFSVGDRVLAMPQFGGYTDTLVVGTHMAVRLPESLGFEKAAAIPVNYLTSWIMLIHLGNLHRGERVLIHAAAGGVGQACLQLARWRGAEIYGTASAGKHARLRELGVHHCIDYHSQDFEAEIARLTGGKGVHVIVDSVGGRSFAKSYRSLAPLGRMYLVGVSDLAPGEKRSMIKVVRRFLSMKPYKPVALMNENRGVHGINMGHLFDHHVLLSEMLGEILGLVERRVLDPVVDRTFPFAQAADAHAYIQAHKNFGKVLLTPT